MSMRRPSVITSASRLFGLAAAFSLTFACTGEMGRQGAPGPTGEQGPEGPEGPQGPSGELDPDLSTLDKALAGIGGQAALSGLTDVEIQASGVRNIIGEGFSAGDDAALISSYDFTVSIDMANDAMRIDWDRSILFAGGAPLTYSEIISGDLGHVDGDDSFFGPAFSTTDMPSARWAAIRKELMLTNPHAILAMVVADPNIATEGGVGLHNDAIHELLVVDDPVHPITLWVNATNGRIGKLTTMENDHQLRDVPLAAHYHDWRNDADGGAAFPMNVFLTLDNQIVHEEYRTAITVNGGFEATRFDFPGGASPVYDAAAASWGALSHQFIQGFSALGIPHNAEQTFVQAEELMPGVYFLSGGSHNSMAIEQQNGVVILEAPLYPSRGEAILTWVENTFSGKPVTHVMLTHHHVDHAAGMRAFVAAGAEIISGSASGAFHRMVATRPSMIEPDVQSAAPMPLDMRLVDLGDSYTISDPGGVNDVSVYNIANGHCDDMLIAHVPTGNYIFESDLWNPDEFGGGALSPFFAADLLAGINDNGLNTPGATIVGGHATYGPVTDLEDFLNN